MDLVKIGGEVYDVFVDDISENFNILYSDNTERSVSKGARMVLDPLGTFYGHEITFRRKPGKENEFDRLFTYISKPRYDGINVEIVHNQTTLNYEAYISTGTRKLQRYDEVNNKVYWSSFTVNIVPMEAQVIPE